MLTMSRVLALFVIVSSCVGCLDTGGKIKQPPLGEVSGTVKLDGQPLPDANVEFRADAGRPVTAKTDSSGRYEMYFAPGVRGVPVGKHTIRISTKINPANDTNEKVPAKYNEKSTETREVKAGQNTIDFDLSTK